MHPKLRFSWRTAVARALDLAIVASALGLGSVVSQLSGSTVVAIVSQVLFLIFGLVVYRLRGTTLRCRVCAFLALYLFKIVPAFAYSITCHDHVIRVEIARLESSAHQPLCSPENKAEKASTSTATKIRRDEYNNPTEELASLRLARSLLFLHQHRPTLILLSIVLTWLGTMAVDFLALVLEYLHSKLCTLEL